MQDNLARFDFGVCMAAWDGDKVYTAPEYKTDIERKTFTLCRADDLAQFNYSMSRFDKMTADRYAGWKLVVPAEIRGDGERARAQKDPLLRSRYRCVDAARSCRTAAADPQSPLRPNRARPFRHRARTHWTRD